MVEWNDAQYRFLEPSMPYECKRCRRGTSQDYYCPFCDAGIVNYTWRRGAIQTLVPAILFGILWAITDVPLFVAPAGLFLLWNLYLLVTASRRMKKHFIVRNPRRN